MKKPMVALIVVILLAAGVGAYFLLGSSYKQKSPEVKLPSEQTNVPKEKNTISIKDFVFNPDTLTVKVGDIVTWRNDDGVVHSIKSTDFSSPNIKNGDTFKFQFVKAGTYEYNCGIHPYMKGKVVVE
ncbi:MAG: cupredoxin family copper-binding protein [bacterium]|nr:cupredoxin family copper-binding protein [bacterium]